MIHFNAAMSPQRLLNDNMRSLIGSMERLATGSRINRGRDDPAGLIAAESLRAELAALAAETSALQRADSVATVADAGLGIVGGLLSEANALIVANANNAGMSDAEREANQFALDSILSAANTAASRTRWADTALLDGSFSLTADGETLDLDRVSTSDLGEIDVDGTTYTTADLGAGGALNIVDGDLEAAQLVMQQAMDDVSTMRGRIGAFQQNTITAAVDSRGTAAQNIAAAWSLIADTDFATEVANLRRDQLAVSTSFLALEISLQARTSVLDLFA